MSSSSRIAASARTRLRAALERLGRGLDRSPRLAAMAIARANGWPERARLEQTVQRFAEVAVPSPHGVPVSKTTRYSVAVIATVLVALTRGALDPWLQDQAILLPFTLAVLVAAVVGGLGPGLVAAAPVDAHQRGGVLRAARHAGS